MRPILSRTTALILCMAFLSCVNSVALAQYKLTKLVANQSGKAKHKDSALVNAWGITNDPGGAFWISDAGSGKTTLYDANGIKEGGSIEVAPASGNAT